MSAQRPNVDSLLVRDGDHVRIRVGGDAGWSFSGHVRDVQRDGLRLVPDHGDTAWIPRWSVFAIEARRGEEFQTRVIGATILGGLTAGGVAAIVMCVRDRTACAAQEQARQRAEDLNEPYVAPEVFYGLAGCAVGALVGAAIAPWPHWEMAVWPTFDAQPGGAGGGSGFGLGLRFAF